MSHKSQAITLGAIMSLLGLVTAASPGIGVALFLVVCFTLLCFCWPLYSFFVVAISSFLCNINVVYISPLRIVSERYTLGVVPVLILVAVVLVKIVAESSERFTRRAVGETVPCKISTSDYLILLFLVWSTVTGIWSNDLYHGVNAFFNLSIGCCLYFLAINLLDDVKKMELFFKVLFVSGVILAAVLMVSNKVDPLTYSLDFHGGFSLNCELITYDQRPGGFAPPPIAANILIFIFFVGCGLSLKAKPAIRGFIAFLSLLFCSAIIATGSKGGAGSFLVSVPALIIFYWQLRKKMIWLIPAFLFVLILVIVFNTLVLGSDRMVASGDVNNLSLTYRLEFWSTGFDMMRQQIMGAGIGGFARLVDPWPGAHSFYFGILFDVGLVGVLVLLVFLVGQGLRLQLLLQQEIDDDLRFYICCLLAYWVAFSIHGLVDFSYYLPHIWLFFGVSVALVKITENSRNVLSNHTLVRWNRMRPNFPIPLNGIAITGSIHRKSWRSAFQGKIPSISLCKYVSRREK